MHQFVNLPGKDGPEIEWKVEENYYRIQTSEGWRICEVGRTTDRQTADDIACAIRFARDAGYKQALADVRRQLGIDA